MRILRDMTNTTTATANNVQATLIGEWPGEDINSDDVFDELSAYCLFHVVVGGAGYIVGACVGVPDYMRGTADAAGSIVGLTRAWWSDASDWQDLPDAATQDTVLDYLSANARRFLRAAIASR